MSQPKRYTTDVGYGHEDEDGEFVLWDDYAALAAELERMRSEHEVGFSSVVLKKWSAEHAALAAENERLRSKLSFSQSMSEICKQVQEGETITVQGSISSGKTVLADLCQCERLRAENERLRKAAQAVYDELHKWGDNSPMVIQNLMDAINAAKEGKDAK